LSRRLPRNGVSASSSAFGNDIENPDLATYDALSYSGCKCKRHHTLVAYGLVYKYHHMPPSAFVNQRNCAAMKSLFNYARRAQATHIAHISCFWFPQSLTSKYCRPSTISSRYIASMASTSRIAALATEIQAQTTKLDKFFTESQMPPPSFDENSPMMYPFPPDVAAAQDALSAALDELWWLNQGPIQTIVAKSVCYK
jgi:hypothetical protein